MGRQTNGQIMTEYVVMTDQTYRKMDRQKNRKKVNK